MEEMTVDFSIKENEKIEATFEVNTQGTRDHEQLINRDKENQHPISSITGLQEALAKTFFPTTIDNSGASAPSSQPQTLGEKYLDTTNKKIYIAEEGWGLKSDVINTATFNGSDGSVTGFVDGKGTYTLSSFLNWDERFDFKVHFKLNEAINVSSIYHIFYSACQSTTGTNYNIALTIRYGKVHLRFDAANSAFFNEDILETDLQVNTEYYLDIIKNGTSLNVVLSTQGYDGTIVEEKSFETQTNSVSSVRAKGSSFGCALIKPNPYSDYSIYGTNLFTIGTIFLIDSYGYFVEKSSSSLEWGGYDLDDESILLDTTNNILYFYKDNKLTPIGV